ncbi:hypothetical protein BCD67_21170 [Oscillatoriales cyanobacterium USR001]|nr:hypothetical protein BCD67_21170 [Oscillatoriales cyanobacterium USR001]
MTTERWDDDRLDRLADRIEGLTSIAERHDRLIESNARVIQALANAAAEAREERQQLFQRMDRQQEEIVGLRIETRRMLDILINQRDRGDNPTA